MDYRSHTANYWAVLSLGSNVAGDCVSPAEQLFRAVDALGNAPAGHRVALEQSSRVFSTPPWGGVEQPDFHNMTIAVSTSLPPLELLHHCQSVERLADRRREVRWGPRTLDVDIVWLGRYETAGPVAPSESSGAGEGASGEGMDDEPWPTQIVSVDEDGAARWGEELILPHPHAHRRAFVLVPWLDLQCAQQPWCTLRGSTVEHWVSTLDPQEVMQVTPI